MLRISLDEEELDALATFVMGLVKPDIPFDYFSIATLNEFKGNREPQKGGAGYSYFCSACHGKNGEGKGYNNFKTGVPAIGNADFLRVGSPEYIRFTIEKGRSLRQMGSWSKEISGLNPTELDGVTNFLERSNESPGRAALYRQKGNRVRGQELYNQYCRTCHGTEGKGDVALALNQEGLLQRAGDQYLMATLLKGRRNAGMPGWSLLEDDQLVDLVAYVSSWRNGSYSERVIELPEPDLEQGALQFHFLCSRCHGEFGEGETGPAIINRDFLASANTTLLYETIALGRPHTAMFGWSTDLYNQEKLERQDISNIIAYMRKSAQNKLTYIYQGSNPGQRNEGALLFEKYCSECHGKSGEGVKAPALNNQEFLSAASNGYLLATITIGRSGTEMPPWGYGDQEHPMLSGRERQDLVAYIRSFQRIHIKY
jgi:mono/diheme cytochrome c family protein